MAFLDEDQILNKIYDAVNNALKVSVTGSNITDGQTLYVPGMKYNGATYDKPRNNMQGTLLASGTRTANIATPTVTNFNARGVRVTLNVTAASGTGGLQIYFSAVGPTKSFQITLAEPTAPITSTATKVWEIYPGISETAFSSQVARHSMVMPRQFYAVVVHGDSSSYTYDVTYDLLV